MNEEERKAFRAKVAEKKSAAWESLAKALRVLGHVVEVKIDTNAFGGSLTTIWINGHRAPVELREESSGGLWHAEPNGRLRWKINEGDATRQFPEPKAGFDFAKIAEVVANATFAKADRDKVDAERGASYRVNAEIAARINTEIGLEPYGRIRATGNIATGTLDVEVKGAFSEEEAREILTLVQRIRERRAVSNILDEPRR